jgi:crotonobetainyl-CoA:carnitine CoA-transferase CaiB-like acyl-CoA transferase
MSITGEADGPPLRTGVAYADLFAGKDAAIAILASLAAVGRGTVLPTGERRLFVSLAHSASAALINVAQNALITGIDARRHGNSHPNLVPYKLFDTADRPIVLAVGNDSQWRACITAIGGLEDLLAERALDTNAGRVGARERVIARLDARLREAGSEHWIEVLSRAGVPCGRLRSVLESLDSVAASPLTGIAPATGGVVRFAPPHLDEHGEQIRRDGWGVFRCAESHDFPRGNGDQVGMEPPVTAS